MTFKALVTKVEYPLKNTFYKRMAKKDYACSSSEGDTTLPLRFPLSTKS